MRTLLLVTGSLFLAACSSAPSFLTPHTIDIHQCKNVPQQPVDKLKPGMTRAQVRFLLGTPLITDLFHANRWDYKYSYQRDHRVTEEKLLSVFFNGDVLSRVEGSAMPTRQPAETTVGKP